MSSNTETQPEVKKERKKIFSPTTKKAVKINCSAFFTRKLTENRATVNACGVWAVPLLAATKTKENAGIREYALNNS